MSNQPSRKSISKWWTLLIVAGAVAVGWLIYRSGPTVAQEEENRAPQTVTVIEVSPDTYDLSVSAYGTVIPARRVVVEPQVTGPVIRLHPSLIPGGRLNKDDELFAIDRTLADLELKESQAQVTRAQASVDEARRKLAEGQKLAQEEVIPETELATLKSMVQIEEAQLAQLQANAERRKELLHRHQILAPFNAIVLNESVEIGQRVDPGFSAATLVGTDYFWVQTSLPVDQLKHIKLPTGDRPGATATVFLDTGGNQETGHQGKVVQLLSDLERTGRMARLLVQIDDPMDLGGGRPDIPLLLGSYVRVEIDAGTLEDVLEIQRPALREGNRIWVAGTNGRLQIRDVRIRWTSDDAVYIDDVLQPGETLITSDLRVALPEMEIEPRPATPDPSRSITSTR